MGIAWLGALLALAALPAVAAAKPHTVVRGPDRFAEFKFPGAHGYRIVVGISEIAETPAPSAAISARKGIYSSGYNVEKVSFESDGHLRFRIPGAGKIDLRFIPGRIQHQPLEKGCKGKPVQIQHGTFRGTIQLQGRQGFTSAHRSSVAGTITEDFKQVCKGSGARAARSATPDKFSETLLVVDGDKALGGAGKGFFFTNFLADRSETNGQPEAPSFTAGASIVHLNSSFFSEVDLTGKQASFTTPDLKGLSEASVEPPAPFTGSATFELHPKESSNWTGDLAVDLPGIGKTPLTGRNFLSDLCHGRHCTDTTGAE